MTPEKKARLIHSAGLMLAVAAAVLAELQKDGRFAWAATALALVTNLRSVAGKSSNG